MNGNGEPRTMKGAPVRAAIYVRVSTEEQAKEGYSLNGQRTRNRAYCEARGWTVAAVYADEGRSAFKDVRRPEYERMMKDSETWDCVLVVNMDRVWRNAKRFMAMMDDLRAAGKDFVSVEDNLDTSTASGRFMMDVLARMKQFESEQTAERVTRGMNQKFSEEPDGALMSRPPLGYDAKDGKLIVNELEAQIVRRAFSLTNDGMPMQKIAETLNREGAKGKNGGTFDVQRIMNILHNPDYAGYLFWSGILRRNGHEPLVDIETFNAAQIGMYRRSKRGKAKEWPLILGPEKIAAERRAYIAKGGKSNAGTARYIPLERPADLDSLIAAHVRKNVR